MKGKVFLIHWSAPEAEELAKPLQKDGWQVCVEAEDGARACRTILGERPDVIVVSLARLPSHGIGTAYYLRSVRETCHLPIVFVGGDGETVANAKNKVPDAMFTDVPKLGKTLSPLSKQKA